MRNIFKRTKTVGVTTSEPAATAVDMVADDVEDLRFAAAGAARQLWKAVEDLDEINEELAEKSKLCGALLAQLRSTNEAICTQIEGNAKLRDQVVELLVPAPVCNCGKGDACDIPNAE